MRRRLMMCGLAAMPIAVVACGAEPATEQPLPRPEATGSEIVAPAPAPAVPIQPGLSWESVASGEGTALRLVGPDGSLRMSIACLAYPSRLAVHVPSFSPIGSEDRFAFALGSQPVTLVADPMRQQGARASPEKDRSRRVSSSSCDGRRGLAPSTARSSWDRMFRRRRNSVQGSPPAAPTPPEPIHSASGTARGWKRSSTMTITDTIKDQGRARGLYDEQLQRLQQEKRLLEGARAPVARIFFPAMPNRGE